MYFRHFEICFPHSANSKKHILIYTVNGPCTCWFYSILSVMERDIPDDTCEKLFKCDICVISFARSSSLKNIYQIIKP